MTRAHDHLLAAAALVVSAAVAAASANPGGIAAGLCLAVVAGLVAGGVDRCGQLLYPASIFAPAVSLGATGAGWAAGVIVAPLLAHVAMTGSRRPILVAALSASASVAGAAAPDRIGAAAVLVAVLVAAEVVVRIHRRLQDEGRRDRAKADELGTLLRVTDVLAALDDDDRAAEAIGELGSEILGGEASVVLVRREGLQVAWSGGEPDLADGPLHHAARAVAARSIGNGRPAWGTDEVVIAAGLAGLQAVPLAQAADGPLGVIVVARATPPTEHDELSLSVFAAHAGRALERILLLQRLADAALRDPLTGVGNRRALDAVLSHLRPGDAVALLDLDHFKAVNDADGHAAGDEVLIDFAIHLRRTTGPHDAVGRWGGEEFMVVLRGAHHQARDRVEQIAEAWRATSPRTTFSAGVALSGRDVSTEELLVEADVALYQAKDEGRDAVRLHGAPTDDDEPVAAPVAPS